MPEKKNRPTFEELEASGAFREFAVECTQLAKTAPTPDKRALYLRMASVWHSRRSGGKRNARRRIGDSQTRRIAANIAKLPELMRYLNRAC
jgi:hypothetical protein